MARAGKSAPSSYTSSASTPITAKPVADKLTSWPGCSTHTESRVSAARAGWADVPAVRNRQIFEIKSADILQPGPAALTDGVAQLHRIVMDWASRHG